MDASSPIEIPVRVLARRAASDMSCCTRSGFGWFLARNARAERSLVSRERLRWRREFGWVQHKLERKGQSGVSAWALGLFLALAPWHAWAQPVDVATRTAARELAVQGADAFERGDYATALDHLTRANTLHPAPSISVLQARALVRLGRFVEALDRYEATTRAPITEDAPEAYRVAAHEAGIESEQLRQRIPQLSVQVRRGRELPQDVTVWLDGKILPKALLDVQFPIDPGDHTILVRGPNFDPVTRSVHLDEKERVVLEITLDDAAPAPVATQMQAGLPDDAASSARATWGWAAVSGGAAALLVSAITGKVALEKKSHLDSVCRPGCPSNSEGDIDAFRSYRTASYVIGGAAVALVGVGGYLILSNRIDSPMTVGVGVVGTNAAVWGHF